jgi:hypothetical protein
MSCFASRTTGSQPSSATSFFTASARATKKGAFNTFWEKPILYFFSSTGALDAGALDSAALTAGALDSGAELAVSVDFAGAQPTTIAIANTTTKNNTTIFFIFPLLCYLILPILTARIEICPMGARLGALSIDCRFVGNGTEPMVIISTGEHHSKSNNFLHII